MVELLFPLPSRGGMFFVNSYKLFICNTSYDSCSSDDKSLVNKDSSASYKYYVTPQAAYKVEGDAGLAADSGLQGLKMGTGAKFKLQNSKLEVDTTIRESSSECEPIKQSHNNPANTSIIAFSSQKGRGERRQGYPGT